MCSHKIIIIVSQQPNSKQDLQVFHCVLWSYWLYMKRGFLMISNHFWLYHTISKHFLVVFAIAGLPCAVSRLANAIFSQGLAISRHFWVIYDISGLLCTIFRSFCAISVLSHTISRLSHGISGLSCVVSRPYIVWLQPYIDLNIRCILELSVTTIIMEITAKVLFPFD